MRLFIRGPRLFGFRPYVGFNPLSIPVNTGAQKRGRGAFVYVIKAGDHIKVGVSVDPLARLRTLQVGNSEPLALMYTAAVKGDAANAYEIEAFAFGWLKRYGLNGEWFKCTANQAIEAIIKASAARNIPIVEVAKEHVSFVIEKAAEETTKESESYASRLASRFMTAIIKALMFFWMSLGMIALMAVFAASMWLLNAILQS